MTSPDFWDALRRSTQARIGLGRAGNGLPMRAELEFRAAHAAARDAVHDELDVAALSAKLKHLWLGDPVVVTSRAADRAEYLRRPDLGREPASELDLPAHGDDLAVVLADGLSARAVSTHAVPFLEALLGTITASVAVPVIVTQARVALGDHIGAALGVRAVLVLIGERPGRVPPSGVSRVPDRGDRC
uniref:ethanolamine ammonia-lyase light chain EutC n=1 Tax=uncultured Jatrophihabitans sp. TaxID=1610747 RepID=UPI0035C96410